MKIRKLLAYAIIFILVISASFNQAGAVSASVGIEADDIVPGEGGGQPIEAGDEQPSNDVDKTAPKLGAGEAKRTSDTDARVTFTSDEPGDYYYQVVSSGELAPTVSTENEGTSITTGDSVIILNDLTAGKKDLYIKVKDKAGNISEALKIEIPAYVVIPTAVGRHAKVNNDVFLGGKYIEVGVSKSGSFGTESAAPSDFHPIKRPNLGFVYDADGFDTGNAMNSGDYFLPGSPYEGFIVGYKNGETPMTFVNSERTGQKAIPSTIIEDLSTEDILSARTSGLTTDNKLKVDQTVAFKVDNKYFKMTVRVTNNTDEILKDVRYMRSVDPDVDFDMKNTYATVNSVPYNFPNDTKSVALAKGPVTGNSLLLMSTDSRSRASLSTADLYSTFAFNDNGTIAESTRDTWMGLTFKLGDLAPGQSEIIEYFYSLDSNIDETIGDIEEDSPGLTDEEAVAKATESLEIGFADEDTISSVINNLTLPATGVEGTTITWETSEAGIIGLDGKVTRPFGQDKEITLTATITKNGKSVTKSFVVKVLKKVVTEHYEPEETSPTTKKEEIVVDVDGENGHNLTKTPITRTTEADGKVKDHVSMSEAIAKDTVEKAKVQGVDTARIVIPDTNDKVSEVVVEIPKTALKELNDGKMKLEIATDNAIISIPTESISSFNDNLYFRVVPLKSKEQQKQVEERAKKEEAVQQIAQNKTVQVLGRPMEIETNMQSREVSIVLPLKDTLPTDTKEREKVLNNLAVFIEHSDGTKEVLRGKVISFKNNGELGLAFNVNKFSTFTIVYMDGAQAFFDGKACGKDTAKAIGCISAKKTVPVYELVNNRLKKVDVLKAGQTVPAYEAISPMLGLGGDVWVERTSAIKYETPSKSMLVKNAATESKRTKQIWKGLELRPGQIGKVTVLKDTVVWEKINKTQKLPRVLKKGKQYRVYRYVPGMYDLGNGKYVVQDEFLSFKSFK